MSEQPQAQANVVQPGKPTHVHSRSAVGQPQTVHPHPSVSGRSEETLSDDGVGDDFVFQENSKQRRKRRRLQQSSAVDNRKQDSVPSGPPTSRSTARRKPLLVGKQLVSRESSGLYAAGPRKIVYCVDNVDQSVTVDKLKKYVEDMGVRVVTCFEVNPRRSQWQRDRQLFPRRKTFRLCINRADNNNLLRAELWTEDVTVSKWFFKSASENTGTRAAAYSDNVDPIDEYSASGVIDNDHLNVDADADMDETVIEVNLPDCTTAS